MSHVTEPNQSYIQQRSVLRHSMLADDPVYLLLNIDGLDVDPVVDELGGGGARILCSKHYDKFYEGQTIGPAVLVLKDVGMPVVYPVVKWKNWPLIGVEFIDIGERERETIIKFLFRLERKKLQQANLASKRKLR